MKSLKDILEAKFANTEKRERRNGTPDFITHTIRGIERNYHWRDETARPFIYNINKDKVLWGNSGDSHNDLIVDSEAETLKEFGLGNVNSVSDLRWDEFYSYTGKEIKREIDQFNKEFPEASKFYLGRIWHAKLKSKKWVAYVVWWNELSKQEFTKLNNKIVKDFNHNFEDGPNEPEIIKYYAIDNNGNLKRMDVNDNKEKSIEARNKEIKDEIKAARAIHLATQKEKREYFEIFRKNRAEHQQKELYNSTKSKTEAEFHNNKTKRYNPITGKMEWGEKIGDSLEIKSLHDYVIESISDIAKIKHVCQDIYSKFEVDPLDYYVYLQDDVSLTDTEQEINKWIKEEVEQIIIDIKNKGINPVDLVINKQWKQFIKLFTKHYKKEPYFDLAIKLYTELEKILKTTWQ